MEREISYTEPGASGLSQNLTPNEAVEADGRIVVADREQLPPLHAASYKGDLAGVLNCITDGHSVHDTINMTNQRSGVVCGITPLFLAAQRGRMKVVKLLVENGANPAQPAWVRGTSDMCTPAEVARLHFHFLVARYLDKAVGKRRKEDRVLQQDEAPPPAPAPGIISRQSSVRAVAAVPPPAPGAATFMNNLGDLSGWDPTTGAQPPETGTSFVAKLLKKTKVDLLAWRPDVERNADGEAVMATSTSRVVDDHDVEVPGVEDHTHAISRYLQDLDLASWNPEDGPALASAPGSRRVSRTGQHHPAPPPAPHLAAVPRSAEAATVADPATPDASDDIASADDTDEPAAPAAVSALPPTSAALTPLPTPPSAAVEVEEAPAAEPVPAQQPVAAAMAAPPNPARQHPKGRNLNTAAAAAAAMARMASRPRPQKPAVAQRWYAHGSDSDDDADMVPSKSVALSPEAAAQLVG